MRLAGEIIVQVRQVAARIYRCTIRLKAEIHIADFINFMRKFCESVAINSRCASKTMEVNWIRLFARQRKCCLATFGSCACGFAMTVLRLSCRDHRERWAGIIFRARQSRVDTLSGAVDVSVAGVAAALFVVAGFVAAILSSDAHAIFAGGDDDFERRRSSFTARKHATVKRAKTHRWLRATRLLLFQYDGHDALHSDCCFVHGSGGWRNTITRASGDALSDLNDNQ